MADVTAPQLDRPEHARERIVADPYRPGRFLAACRCGDYAENLESKRAGIRWQTRHLQTQGPDAVDELATPAGRGRLAAVAHRRALDTLAARHADEAVELENAERLAIGLGPLPPRLLRRPAGR